MKFNHHASQFSPAKFGTLRFWIGPPEEWPGEVREDVGLAVFAARNWGPECLNVAHEPDADISIRWADGLDGAAGLWTPSKRLIQIDYEKCHGRYERRRAILHEIGHALGCSHVTEPTALMFEALGIGGSDPTAYPTDAHMDETQLHPIDNGLAVDFVTAVDIAEFNRARSKPR